MAELKDKSDLNQAGIRSKRSNLVDGLAAAGVLLVLVLVAFPVHYEINDDFSLVASLSGGDGFSAHQDVYFLSQILSWILATLYRAAPGVAWYGVLLYLSAWLGSGLFFSALFSSNSNRLSKILIIPVYIVFLGHCLYSITFTSASLLLELGSFFYVLEQLNRPPNKRKPGFAPLLCLTLAYLWRWRVVLFSAVFAAPLLPLFYRRDWKKTALYCLPLLFIIASDQTWRYFVYRDVEHQEFVEFLNLRSNFHDSSQGAEGPSLEHALSEAGWTEDDYRIYRSRWMLYDQQFFHSDSLKRFLGANDLNIRETPWLRFRGAVGTAMAENRHYWPMFLFAAIGLLCSRGRVLMQSPRKEMLLAFLTLGLIAAPMALVAYQRFVPRVSIPLFIYFLSAMLVIRPDNLKDNEINSAKEQVLFGRFFMAIAVLMFVCSAVWGVGVIAVEYRQSLQAKRVLSDISDCLQQAATREGKSPILIRLNAGFGLQQDVIHPLRESPPWRDYRLMPGGWATNSPRYKAILRDLNLPGGRELLQSAIDSDEIVFVLYHKDLRDDKETLRLWESYFNRRLKRDTEDSSELLKLTTFHDCRKRAGEGLVLYRLVAVKL